uniref:ribosomal protein L23 n=1 Tax=Dracocephalum psammophilum TaxID=2875946 RepID=UPI001F140558|nr:ribosomal protein L23 [Dracocephalum psammophilum]UKS09566.1 ribosomal protein L23 [Dracocephalum psammophilum]
MYGWNQICSIYRQIRLLGKNKYTSNVESGSTRTELKHWVELFFGVKVIAMNSHVIDFRERVEEWDPLWDIQCITDV